MTDIQKYTPLKTIVSYFLDQNDKSIGEFDKYWIIAFRGLVKMGFQVSWEPLTVRLPVSSNGTVILPSDYLAWTKIGVINSSGEVSTLKVNRSLTTLKDTNPNRQSYLTADTPDIDFGNIVLNPYYLNYFFGNWYTPLFGLGNGLIQYGECRVDEKNNVIVLNPGYPFSDLLLEYISSPVKNNDYQIETAAQEALIAFMNWKAKLGSAEEYYAELREARRTLKPIQLQVMNQVSRESNGFKIKS